MVEGGLRRCRPLGRRGRWRSGAESRQRILDAARALFRERGYAGTTVRAVAAEAGVDSAMVFYFFGTKQGLFAAAVDMSARVPPRHRIGFRRWARRSR